MKNQDVVRGRRKQHVKEYKISKFKGIKVKTMIEFKFTIFFLMKSERILKNFSCKIRLMVRTTLI